MFTARRWRPEDGDPGRPESIGGVEVIERLRTRRDRPGALVALADGRYAYTGRIVGMGSAAQLQDDAKRRLRNATDDADRAWWREVIGAVAMS